MIVFVTGASGFVGRIVANEAMNRGMTVHGSGRTASAPAGFGGNWHQVEWDRGVGPLVAILEKLRPDLIIHAAGSASVGDSFKTPYADLQASLGTWALVLEAVRSSGQSPVIAFPSSAAVYGNPQSFPVSEESGCQPVSPYGWHKLLCENLAREHASAFGARIVVTRLFSVIGRHQRRLLVWELFERLQREPGALSLMGSGQESRDFIGELDVAQAILDLALLRNQMPSKTDPLIVNLASGKEITTLQMAKLLVDLCAPGREIVCLGQERPGDPLRWCADLARLNSLLPDFKASPLPESLRDTMEGWRACPCIAPG